LSYYRSDQDARDALAARVQSAPAKGSITMRIQVEPQSPGLRSSASFATPSRSRARANRTPGTPDIPTGLGTANSWSSLDTVTATGADPVGSFKEVAAHRVKSTQPPLKFGFESEGARRRQYAERMTPALLGPQEPPLGSTFAVRDTERDRTLVHSPLPATLRPTPRLRRGMHATARHPHAQASWQPASRAQGWQGLQLAPPQVSQPPLEPVTPDAEATAARAAQRAKSASACCG
jgi:hypothetical protein